MVWASIVSVQRPKSTLIDYIYFCWLLGCTLFCMNYFRNETLVFFELYSVPLIRKEDALFYEFINSLNSNLFLCTVGTLFISAFFVLGRKFSFETIDIHRKSLIFLYIILFLICIAPMFEFFMSNDNMYPLYTGRGSFGAIISTIAPSLCLFIVAKQFKIPPTSIKKNEGN